MTRKLAHLGLAFGAVLALGVGSASSAIAAEFHTTVASTKLSGSQTNIHVFKTTAGEVTCENATFTGTMNTSTSFQLTLNPTYTGCHIIFGFTISATIATNGCTYAVYSNGGGNLSCPAGKAITVTGAGCTISIGTQGFNWFSYVNRGVTHLDITAAVTAISYSHSGFACGTGSGGTGSYSGTITTSAADTSGGNRTISWY